MPRDPRVFLDRANDRTSGFESFKASVASRFALFYLASKISIYRLETKVILVPILVIILVVILVAIIAWSLARSTLHSTVRTISRLYTDIAQSPGRLHYGLRRGRGQAKSSGTTNVRERLPFAID